MTDTDRYNNLRNQYKCSQYVVPTPMLAFLICYDDTCSESFQTLFTLMYLCRLLCGNTDRAGFLHQCNEDI